MSFIQKIGGSLFLPTIIFVTSVNNVFSNNSSEFNYQADILLFFITGFCMALLVTLLFFILSKWTIPRLLAVLSISIGTHIFLWNILQTVLQDNEHAIGYRIALEVFIFTAVTIALFRIDFSKLNSIVAIFSAVLLAFGVYEAGAKFAEAQNVGGMGRDKGFVSQKKNAFTGNVYHLVFDQYQSEWWPLVREPEKLNGIPLTYYKKFHSNDPYTQSSMASLNAGRVFRTGEDPNKSWMKVYASEESLFTRLSQAGVSVHRFPHYKHHCKGSGTRCTPTVRLKQLASKLPEFIDMWFWQLLPSSVRTQYDNEKGQDWKPGISLSNTLAELGVLDKPGPEMNQKPALVQFRNILNSEEQRPSTGQYVYAHFLLPHTPWNLDKECQIYTKEKNQRGTVLCVNVLISRFLNKLVSLKRLDNSLVIIHSDHGLFYYGENLNKMLGYKKLKITKMDRDLFEKRPPWGKPTSSWSSNMIKARAAALALFKWPNQQQSIDSNLDIHTINIAPTILDFFGVDHADIEAKSIQELEKISIEQDHNFYIPNTWQKRGLNSVSHYTRIDGEWKFVSEVWNTRKN